MTTTTSSPVQRSLPVRRRPRWLQHPKIAAVIAAVVAVVLTPAGAGVGIRYLTKNGWSGTSVLGLAVLLIGLLLFAYAGVVAWRATHRWQRLWFLPVVLVALLVMWPIAQGTMLAYAPRNGLGSATPADRGLTYTDVSFRTSDGVLLSAWFVPSTNHAAIVTMPGAGSNRTATLAQAAVLAQHGYGVLMLDPRGQGRSGGHAMDAGWWGDRDLTAAVAFLQHQAGVDANRIGVLGLSMGGEEAIGAAAADPAIRAVVAEGATHRTAADKAGYLPGGVAGGIQRGMDQITYGVAGLLSPAPQPITLHTAIARAQSTPFLLIAGSKAVDEPEAVAYLRMAAPDRVQTWTVPGATHTHGLATAPAEWTTRVTTFFDQALEVTPTAQLQAKLLTAGDLGSAWRPGQAINRADLAAFAQVPCAAATVPPAIAKRLTAVTGTQFEPADRSYRHVIELVAMGRPTQLDRDLRSLFGAIESCMANAPTSGGRVSVGTFAIPALGDQRAAYTIIQTGSAGAATALSVRIGYVRVGSAAVALGLADFQATAQGKSNVSNETYRQLLKGAVAKLSG